MQEPPFRSLPFLSNPHVQTVVANFMSWPRDRIAAEQHLVTLDDGDRVMLHETTPESGQATCCVLLLHGLGGSHRSGYLRRIANELSHRGLRVYRMDLRGCGAGMAYARRFYNAACSGDVRAALEWIRERNPEASLLLAGFSLGGNIALKLAGEAADDPVPGLIGVASVGAPIDLVRCSEMIKNFPFYDRYYVRRLVKQVKLRGTMFPDLPTFEFPERVTLRDFDEIYTAPLGGFADALDYYRKASALPWIPAIRLPTYLLTARDDPFIAWEPYADLPPRPGLTLHLAARGGHLGFLGRDGRGGIRWAETQVIDWILRHVPSVEA